MPYERSQNNFSTGELDPRLHSRIDINRYRSGTATARDVILTPQGPFKRRPGTVLDDDGDQHPTWILPFKLSDLTVNKNASTEVTTESFTWTSAGVGSEETSDNEISFDSTYEIAHVFCSAVNVSSDRTEDFDARIEFFDSARSNWVATPYFRVPKESADQQDGGGGNLIQLSDQADEGLRLGGFTKMRARIRSMPDASVTLSVTFGFRGTQASDIERSNVRWAPFNVSETEQFIVVFTDECITVYEQNTAGSGERELIQRASLDAPWDHDMVESIDWVQAFDTMIVAHEDVQTRELVREGDGRFWRLDTMTFGSEFVVSPDAIHIPQEPVDDASADNAGQPLIDHVEFYNFSASDEYQLVVDGEPTERLNYDNTASTNVSRIQSALDALPGFSGTFTVSVDSGGTLYSIEYDFTDKSLVPTLTDVEVIVLQGSGVIGHWREQNGKAHTNDKWSASNGWPRSVTLYQGRLWFGGSPSYPDEIWGSRVDDIRSFWNESNLDNEAIVATIRSRQLLNIRAIYPGRNLQFFTDAAEFFAPQSLNEPLTPNNFIIERATNRGIRADARPVEVTGVTMFLEPNNGAVREFLFVETEQSYTAQDVSLLSAHLLETPKAMVRWPSISGQEFDLVLFPQGSSGDMAVFGTLRDQDVGGWFHWTGDWLDCAVMLESLYGALQTTINGDPVNVVTRFDSNAFMDLLIADPAVSQTISDGVISNLYIHKGKTVQIRVDDSFYDTAVLTSSGDDRYTGAGDPQIDLETSIDSSYQIGQGFTPRVVQLPTAIETEGGLIWMDRKKRIKSGTVEVRDTAAIEIATADDGSNTERYASQASVGTDPPETTTGRVHFAGRLGWGDDAALTIEQPLPYPMEVLAIQTAVDL